MILDDDDINAPPLSGADSVPPPTSDPPPPYPSRRARRAGTRRQAHHQPPHHGHGQLSSTESRPDDAHGSPRLLLMPVPFPDDHHGPDHDDDDDEAHEASPFLPPTPRSTARRLSGRPRAHSHTSSVSVAPSLGQTVLSLFRTAEDEDGEGGRRSDLHDHFEGRLLLAPGVQGPDGHSTGHGQGRVRRGGFFSSAAWGRYFRPMGQAVYWRALFHLAVVNWPYALAAWVYLFVFTVAGTTLLMALPLGAILCFLNLLGARAFARGELALQTRFHSPLAYPAPYPPRPIFTRTREANGAEVEAGAASIGGTVRERSFYRNAYAMFTDPTSYQALFYFLVIKPSITLVLSLALVVCVLPALILVLPAPPVLRAVRRLGAWQANVAVEGLYLAVR